MRILRPLLSLLSLSLLVACASPPSAQSPPAWRDPNFSGKPFARVFVIGLSSRDLQDRRGFEDQMVQALRSGGTDAVAAWQYLPGNAQADQATIRAAYARSGADSVLLARFMGFSSQDQVVGTAIVPGPPVGGPVGLGIDNDLYGTYSSWYGVPIDQQYQVATIYTTLFDGRTMKQVWTYNPQTFNPSNLRQQTSAYAYDVAAMLQQAGLVLVQ
jgi:hypothetical protein